jgi:glycosyltransferase involved in cell wall biosynthesis
MKKLSVIIPVYNVEEYLEECVENLYFQDLEEDHFEVILINDGSTDNSLRVAEELKTRHSNIVIFSQKNSGQSVARNKGIELSEGEYLFFIDSDDFIIRNAIQKLLALAYQSNLSFLGFQSHKTSERVLNETLSDEIEVIFQGTGYEIIKQINFNNGPWWYIFKKSILGNLRFVEGRTCEDGLFTAELFQKVDCGKIISNSIYRYFNCSFSTVHQKNVAHRKRVMDDMFFAIKEFDNVLAKIPLDIDEYNVVFNKLRTRQESYLFYAIIRFLGLHAPSRELFEKINTLNFKSYSVYPIAYFKGYNQRDRFLLKLMNNKTLLKLLNLANRILKII